MGKLASLPDTENFLKPGVTLGALREKACVMSGNEAAKRLNTACSQLFQSINNRYMNDYITYKLLNLNKFLIALHKLDFDLIL